jgi:hypothetical protein
MLTKLFAPLAVRIFGGLAVFLLLALTVQTARMHHYHADRDRWHTAFDAQKAAYVAEQKAALAKAIAQKIETENRYAVIARQADAEREESNRLRSAADEYARTHRVRWSPDMPAGQSASTSQGSAPARDDGPDRSADWIAISPADYGRYNQIVDRMQRVKQWGDDLQRAGLAVPEVEFGR